MASLLTIPLELIVAVSAHLNTPDLGALRLTCKQVEKSLFEWFSKEFFTKKQFMLTYESLQTFIEISKHANFSKKLTHVIIATNAYRSNPSGFKDAETAARYLKGTNDQKTLMSTGFDREMLTEAFGNLQNLHTVGIRDFNNDKRSRDGTDASWTSWGATTVLRETGVPLQFSQEWPSFVTHLFQTLILALAKSKRTPDEFEVLLRRGSLLDGAFHLPDFLEPTIRPVLQSLKTLLLTVDVSSRHTHAFPFDPSLEPVAGASLREFLGHTPNVTQLRFNLQKYQTSNNEDFLRWLSKAPNTPGSSPATLLDPASVALAHLTKLELGTTNTRPQLITGVIAKFAPTLQSLSLWRLSLYHSDQFTDPSRKLNMWADLFAQLAKMPGLQLEHLKVGMLGQDTNRVQFKCPRPDDATPVKVKEYSGKNMAGFYKELRDEVFVLWPEESVHNDSDEMEDNDDEDDSDEEMEDEDDDDEGEDDGA